MMKFMTMTPAIALIIVAALAFLPFAAADDADPTYYVDCSVATPALTLALGGSATCPASTTSVMATGPGGATYTTTASSNVVIYVSGTVTGVTATYTLVDVSQGGATVASGAVPSTNTNGAGCNLVNTLTGSGTATGITVHAADTLKLTLSFNQAVTVCTGGVTPTAVSVGGTSVILPPPVPQFPLGGALLLALALPVLLLMRSKLRTASV